MQTDTGASTYARVHLTTPGSSAALQELDRLEARYQATIERRARDAADRAEKMPKADLIEKILTFLGRDNEELESKTHDQLTETYVDAFTSTMEEQIELERLRTQAHADRLICHYLNSRIQQAEELHADLMKEVEGGPKRAAAFMETKGAHYHRLQHGAHLASEFGRALKEGAEIREYTERLMADLFRQILRFPRDLASAGSDPWSNPELLHRNLAATDVIADIRLACRGLDRNPIVLDVRGCTI